MSVDRFQPLGQVKKEPLCDWARDKEDDEVSRFGVKYCFYTLACLIFVPFFGENYLGIFFGLGGVVLLLESLKPYTLPKKFRDGQGRCLKCGCDH